MRINIKNRAVFYALSIFLICLAVSFTALGTLGKFVCSFTGTDSAEAAKFDIEIIAPEEFAFISDDNPYQYSFSEQDETKELDFKIINKKDVPVICTPYIDNHEGYEVYAAGSPCGSFIVEAGKTVDFKIIIMTAQLNENAQSAALVLDIQQFQGGELH